jgi:hypothetical protein
MISPACRSQSTLGVAAVPDESEHAARSQDPRDLGHRRSGWNQCHAWPATTASTEASSIGMSSAVPRIRGTPGTATSSSSSISSTGSTAMTSRSSCHERLGQLARARAEVEHAHRVADEPGDRVDRVARPRLVVHGCRGAERARVRTRRGVGRVDDEARDSSAAAVIGASFMPRDRHALDGGAVRARAGT